MAVKRHIRDLCRGVPQCHVKCPDGDAALAVPTRLLPSHHQLPRTERIQIGSGMADQPPGDRAVILACSIRSLRDYVLDAECACGRCVHYPLGLMAAAGVAGMTIASLIVQLRCKNCGKRPVRVALLEHGTAGMALTTFDGSAGSSGWVVPLVGGDLTTTNSAPT